MKEPEQAKRHHRNRGSTHSQHSARPVKWSNQVNNETIEHILRQGIPGFDDAFIDRAMERLNKISPMTCKPAKPVKHD